MLVVILVGILHGFMCGSMVTITTGSNSFTMCLPYNPMASVYMCTNSLTNVYTVMHVGILLLYILLLF